MMNKLDELEKLAKAATPGPWWSEVAVVEAESCLSASLKEAGKPTTIEEMTAEVMSSHVVVADCSSGLSDRPLLEIESNAGFIAAANPDTVLKLIAVARAVQSLKSAQKAMGTAAALGDLEEFKPLALGLNEYHKKLDEALEAFGDD